MKKKSFVCLSVAYQLLTDYCTFDVLLLFCLGLLIFNKVCGKQGLFVYLIFIKAKKVFCDHGNR